MIDVKARPKWLKAIAERELEETAGAGVRVSASEASPQMATAGRELEEAAGAGVRVSASEANPQTSQYV